MELEAEARGGEEREGRFLLGSPRFEDIGNGRLRCAETGHELPAKDVDAYAKSKACRLAMIDSALSRKKPPLNMFKADPLCKSKLICKLTGDGVNKTEEHIWKHVTGRRFLNKLKQKEEDKDASSTIKKNKNSPRNMDSSTPCSKKVQKRNKNKDDCVKTDAVANGDAPEVEAITTGGSSEEPNLWMPPVGDRWDLVNGKDRWALNMSSDGARQEPHDGDSAAADLSARTKRMSIAVGPSSFASRKKKSRKNNINDSNDN